VDEAFFVFGANMEKMSFARFQTEFFRMYSAKEYKSALAFMQQYGPQLRDHETVLANWRICAAALDGNPELALRYFQEALDDGFWFAPEAFHGDPDLASLQGNPEFERMVAVVSERQAKATRDVRPELLTFLPEQKSDTYPLMLAMHPWGSTARAFGEHYEFLASQGWLVAVAQSSQIAGRDLYCWDDFAQGKAEVIAHFEALKQQYPIDPQRILLSGFSQGGGLALGLAVSREIPAAGFIALGPFIPEWDDFVAALPAGPIESLRGYLLTGEQEQHPVAFEKMEQLLQERQVPYQRETLLGYGHEIPAGFDTLLEKAIQFVVAKETV
jgi:predicted esterase